MTEQERKETRQEAKILSVLKHPSIINFREVFTTVSNKLCIVMDYADGGDLQKKIKEAKGRFFAEPQILDWLTQICLGLKHVHDRKILHRDIKAQNIFMTKTNCCLLGDFGIAKILSSTKGFARTVVGTPYYLSPEILESKNYSFQSDIWSLGILLYELCALKPPFDAPNLPLLGMRIVRGDYTPLSSHYSRELRNLVTQMLIVDPNKRPTIHQILKMGFIQARAKSFLSETEYSNEFSHTILHSINVLDGKENKGPRGMAGKIGINNDSAVFGLPPETERKKRQERRLKEKEMAERKRIEELQRKIEEENEKKRIEEAERRRLEELQWEEEKKKQERREDIAKLKGLLHSPKNKERQITATPIIQPVVKKNDKVQLKVGKEVKTSVKKQKDKKKVKDWDEQRKRMKEDIKCKKIQPKKQNVEDQCVLLVAPEKKNEGFLNPEAVQRSDTNEEESKKRCKKANRGKTKTKSKKPYKDNPELDKSGSEEKLPIQMQMNEEKIKQEEIKNYMLIREEMQKLISNQKEDSSEECEALVVTIHESFEKDRDDVVGFIEEETTPKEITPIEETKHLMQVISREPEYVTDNECIKKYLEGIFGEYKTKSILASIIKIVLV